MNLDELRRNYTESQTENSELAAKNKERPAIVAVLFVFVAVFLLAIILLVIVIIKMRRKISELSTYTETILQNNSLYLL